MREWMDAGGPIAWMIGVCGLAGIVLFVERLLHLRRARVYPQDFLRGIFTVVRRHNIAEAVSLCDETPGPVARIVRAALLHMEEPPESVRRAMVDAGLTEIPRLEKRVRGLAVIARMAPMLGLLGTALALMDALLWMHQRAPLIHAGDLTGALWRASLCTAMGLAVAIPAFAGYHILAGKVSEILVDMERTVGEMLDGLARESRRADRRRE